MTFSETLNFKKWAITSIAGMQFYDYDTEDNLVGQVRPKHGDRIQLVRQPKNIHDPNAVEIWWRDARFQLGHIPRKEAAELAPLLDAGCNVVGHIWHGGNGCDWSAQVVLIHDEIPQSWHVRSIENAADDLDDWMDQQSIEKSDEVPGFKAVEKPQKSPRDRRLDALVAFMPILFPGDDRDPKRPPEPPRKLRNTTLTWWDQIPEGAGLMTKTGWSDAGFKIKKRVTKPFAFIEYTARRERVRYELYSSSQVMPKKRLSDLQFAKKLLARL